MNKQRYIDLTHTIEGSMPVYPGTEGPKLRPANTIERDGFRETGLSMYSHTGTHMDAPGHIFPCGATLDSMDISCFAGTALAVDCSTLSKGARITMELLAPYKALLEQAEFALFHTGWEALWGTPEYFCGFPVCDTEVLEYLARSHKKGIGVDAISIDPVADETLPNHRIVLSGGMVVMENLCGLQPITGKLFTLLAMPLKFSTADGAPIRAVAVLD